MTAWQYTNPRGCLEKNLHLNNAAIPPRPPAPGSDGVVIEVISTALNPAVYKLTELPLISYLSSTTPLSPNQHHQASISAAELSPAQMVVMNCHNP
jgi:hypothetical protein